MFLYCHHFEALNVQCCHSCHDEHEDRASYYLADIVCADGGVYDIDICCKVLAALHALSKEERQRVYAQASRYKWAY